MKYKNNNNNEKEGKTLPKYIINIEKENSYISPIINKEKSEFSKQFSTKKKILVK